MRHSLGIFSCILLFSSHSFAQIEGLDVEGETAAPKEEKAPAASSEYDSNDIAYKEKSDAGPFAPKSQKDQEAQAVKGEGPLSSTRYKNRKPLNVGMDIFIGFGKAPALGPAGTTTTDTSGVTLVVGGSYDLSPKISVGLAIPWTSSGVQGAQTIFGSPHLVGQYRTTVARLTDLTAFLGFGLPVGQGDLDPTKSNTAKSAQGQAARFADASSGYRSGEFFMPRTIPIVPGVRLAMYRGKIEGHASTKISAAINLGDVESPTKLPSAAAAGSGKIEKRGVALRNVTELGGTYEILEKGMLFAGLDGWMTILFSEPMEFASAINAQAASPLQLGLEPRVGTTLGPITPTLGYILPLGGKLGDAGIQAVHLAATGSF